MSIPQELALLMGDSILDGLIEENVSKQHNVRIRKFPGATVDDLNYHVPPILRKKPQYIIDCILFISYGNFDGLWNT